MAEQVNKGPGQMEGTNDKFKKFKEVNAKKEREATIEVFFEFKKRNLEENLTKIEQDLKENRVQAAKMEEQKMFLGPKIDAMRKKVKANQEKIERLSKNPNYGARKLSLLSPEYSIMNRLST